MAVIWEWINLTLSWDKSPTYRWHYQKFGRSQSLGAPCPTHVVSIFLASLYSHCWGNCVTIRLIKVAASSFCNLIRDNGLSTIDGTWWNCPWRCFHRLLFRFSIVLMIETSSPVQTTPQSNYSVTILNAAF